VDTFDDVAVRDETRAARAASEEAAGKADEGTPKRSADKRE